MLSLAALPSELSNPVGAATVHRGGNDPFVNVRRQFDEAVVSRQDARVHWVASGNHSFEVKGARRPAEEIGAGLAGVVAAFARGV
ncbi:hypothetical protein M3672_07495 [Microbacterium enclense]|nr:hypothetical protein [Microbacterium enclense]